MELLLKKVLSAGVRRYSARRLIQLLKYKQVKISAKFEFPDWVSALQERKDERHKMQSCIVCIMQLYWLRFFDLKQMP